MADSIINLLNYHLKIILHYLTSQLELLNLPGLIITIMKQSINTLNNLKPFSYSQHLTKAVKQIGQSTLTNESCRQPSIESQIIIGEVMKCQSSLYDAIQSEQLIIFTFIHVTTKCSKVKLYYFLKQNGRNHSKNILDTNNKIVCCRFGMLQEKETFKMVLLMGTQDGILKSMMLSEDATVKNLTIDKRGIVDICVPKNLHNSYCLALTQDYVTYMVSYKMNIVIAHFRSNYIDCDRSLNIRIHSANQYFLETTVGGYISIWSISDNIRSAINLAEKGKFTLKDKTHSTFPLLTFHSASIDGLLWADFFGDLILIVTKKGQFKILAVNAQSFLEQSDDYVTIIKYIIPNIQQVRSFQLNIQGQYVVYCRNKQGESYLQKLEFSSQLWVNRVYRYKLKKLQIMEECWVSEQGEFIMSRNKQHFFVGYSKRFNQKEDLENKEQSSLNQNY